MTNLLVWPSFLGVAVPEQEAIDPYDLIEAVEILSKLPKDFYENLVSAYYSGMLYYYKKEPVLSGN